MCAILNKKLPSDEEPLVALADNVNEGNEEGHWI